MRARLVLLALALLGSSLAGCASNGPVHRSTAGAGAGTPRDLIDVVRQASAWLDTPQEARQAGYTPAPYCVPGEGVHWVRQASVDAQLDPFEPEAVLFEPTTSNTSDPEHLRFVGVEYVAVTEGTPHNSTANPPSLLGVPLDGPMPGHAPHAPWHASLHVYTADGIESDATFPAQHAGPTCPEGTRAPGAQPARPTSHDPDEVVDARSLDDCEGVTDRTVHDHAELLVYLDDDTPFDFSPDRYQLATRQVHIEGGQRDANGTIVHVHAARPTLDCVLDTFGWEASSNTIVTDGGHVFVGNETHRIQVRVDGRLSQDGMETPLHHGSSYVVRFGPIEGRRAA